MLSMQLSQIACKCVDIRVSETWAVAIVGSNSRSRMVGGNGIRLRLFLLPNIFADTSEASPLTVRIPYIFLCLSPTKFHTIGQMYITALYFLAIPMDMPWKAQEPDSWLTKIWITCSPTIISAGLSLNRINLRLSVKKTCVCT
jgi:hypothetical protein